MENNQNTIKNSSKKVWLLFGILVLIIIVAVIITSTNKKSANKVIPEKVKTASSTATTTEKAAPVNYGLISPALKDAAVVIPGASPVKDNQVMTLKGKPAANNSTPMAPDAPQQTGALDKATIDKNDSVIKINVSEAGFSPNSFGGIKAGSVVNIAVTSVDEFTHIFAFRDASLSAVAIGLAPGETRAITFNAPAAGTYEFYCNVPGHGARGEVGKMVIVK